MQIDTAPSSNSLSQSYSEKFPRQIFEGALPIAASQIIGSSSHHFNQIFQGKYFKANIQRQIFEGALPITATQYFKANISRQIFERALPIAASQINGSSIVISTKMQDSGEDSASLKISTNMG